MVGFDQEHDENKSVVLSESIERALGQKCELTEEDGQDMDGNNNSSKKKYKKKLKRGKKKKHNQSQLSSEKDIENHQKSEAGNTLEVEYVQDFPEISELEPMYRQFASVFESFRFVKPEKVAERSVPGAPSSNELVKDSDDEDEKQEDQGDENEAPLSRRKLKLLQRPSIADLKRQVSRPDIVEMHDVTARDPLLLVQLKAARNTVPVPSHWSSKTKYLYRKRGIAKPPFELPHFLKRTGITEIRATQQDIEANKTLKGKTREKVRPTMGRIDIEYEKLYDAFFKWQTKPRMTIHGDLYYEGKEYETKMLDKKPGVLSDELRHALGMPGGHNAHKHPPPFLIAMQRYGPPPSYPHLKVPGLNAPLPEGCAFGYHVGGWGKTPVDVTGKPLYGDVFGISQPDDDVAEEVDRHLWGESESSDEEDEDGEGEEDEDKDEGSDDTSGLETPLAESIAASDLETKPEDFAGLDSEIELRKKKIEKEMESHDAQSLYTVIKERKTEGLGASMMGSIHLYDMTGAGGQVPPSVIAASRRGTCDSENLKAVNNSVELALDPSELDLDSKTMASKYEQTMQSQREHSRENMSDMLQEHLKRQKGQNKRKHLQTSDVKSMKKYKEFKF